MSWIVRLNFYALSNIIIINKLRLRASKYVGQCIKMSKVELLKSVFHMELLKSKISNFDALSNLFREMSKVVIFHMKCDT